MTEKLGNDLRPDFSDSPQVSQYTEDDEKNDRNLLEPIGNILRIRQVCKKTGLSRSGIYDGISKGIFPPQMHLSQRRVGWYEPLVDSWIRARIKSIGEN